MRKWGKRIGVQALLLAAVVFTGLLVAAAPAQAGACHTAGCGGIVTNVGGNYIRVANNWCWSSSTPYIGDQLPCVSYPGTSINFPADFELYSGGTTSNFWWYMDTDAFRIYRGCWVAWYDEVSGYHSVVDRRGEVTSEWRKVYSNERIRITGISCV